MNSDSPDVVIVPVPHGAEANRLVGGLRALGITADCPSSRNATRHALSQAKMAVCVISVSATQDQVHQALTQLRPGASRAKWIVLGPEESNLVHDLSTLGIRPLAWLAPTTSKENLPRVMECLRSHGIHGLQVAPKTRSAATNIRRPRTRFHVSALVAIGTIIAGFTLGYFLALKRDLDQAAKTIPVTVIAPAPTPVAPTPPPAPEPKAPLILPPMGPPHVISLPRVIHYAPIPELTGPVQLVGPPYIPPPPPPPIFAIEPIKLPTLEVPGPLYTREAKAIVHVISTLDEANRTQGLEGERLESLVTRFANPAYIEGRGEQTHNGMKASLQLRSEAWPAWREVPIAVSARPEGDFVIVEVKSRFRAENRTTDRVMADEVTVAYTVTFDSKLEVPLIRRVTLKPADQAAR